MQHRDMIEAEAEGAVDEDVEEAGRLIEDALHRHLLALLKEFDTLVDPQIISRDRARTCIQRQRGFRRGCASCPMKPGPLTNFQTARWERHVLLLE